MSSLPLPHQRRTSIGSEASPATSPRAAAFHAKAKAIAAVLSIKTGISLERVNSAVSLSPRMSPRHSSLSSRLFLNARHVNSTVPLSPKSNRAGSPRHSRKRAVEDSNYKVLIRVRPYLPSELNEELPVSLFQPDGSNKINFLDKTTLMPKEVFVFNSVFWDVGSVDPAGDQAKVFEQCGAPIVASAWEGYNGSILAYGQTSSGKTHTMMGSSVSEQDEGIIPRLCKRLFSGPPTLPGVTNSEVHEVSFDVSFMEIYNEQVLDLLDSSPFSKLRVRNHPVTGPFVDGLQMMKVTNWQEAHSYIKKGNESRHVGSTRMNEQSSRSHAVFQIILTQSYVTDMGTSRMTSTIHLVDLAGSERVKHSGVEGDRFRETTQINLSLSTLRRVIDALVSKNKFTMVPYRDSTLTWLLSESLGGNSRSFLIGTLCPHPKYAEETYNTLQYAHRAKEITNHIVKNEDDMSRLIHEIKDQLRLQGEYSDDEDTYLKKAMVEELQAQQSALENKYSLVRLELEKAKKQLEQQNHEKREDDEVRESMQRRITQAENALNEERTANKERMMKIKRKYDSVQGQRLTLEERVKDLERDNSLLRAEVEHNRESTVARRLLVHWMISTQCKLAADSMQFEDSSRIKLELYESHVSSLLSAFQHRISLLDSQVAHFKFEVDHLYRDRKFTKSQSTLENDRRQTEVSELQEQLRIKNAELERARAAIAEICETYVQVRDFIRPGAVPPATLTTRKVLETLKEFCDTWGKYHKRMVKMAGNSVWK